MKKNPTKTGKNTGIGYKHPPEQYQFKKGHCANPAGRPSKKDCLTSLLRDEIEKICPTNKQGKTWKELIVIATMAQAVKGNPAALREIWDRMDGKVTQPISSDSDQPINLVFTDADLYLKRKHK